MAPIRYDVDRNFHSHKLDENQTRNVMLLTDQFVELAKSIKYLCPENGETILALRSLEVAKMQAVASISRGPQ